MILRSTIETIRRSPWQISLPLFLALGWAATGVNRIHNINNGKMQDASSNVAPVVDRLELIVRESINDVLSGLALVSNDTEMAEKDERGEIVEHQGDMLREILKTAAQELDNEEPHLVPVKHLEVSIRDRIKIDSSLIPIKSSSRDKIPVLDPLVNTDSELFTSPQEALIDSSEESLPISFVGEITPATLETFSLVPEGREALRNRLFKNGIFLPTSKEVNKEAKLHYFFRENIIVNGREAEYRKGERKKGEEELRYYYVDGKGRDILAHLGVGDRILSGEEELLQIESAEQQKVRTDFLGEDWEGMVKNLSLVSRRTMVNYLDLFGDDTDKLFAQRIFNLHRDKVFGGKNVQNELLYRYYKGIDFGKFLMIKEGVTPDKKRVLALLKHYFPNDWRRAIRVAEKEGKLMAFTINHKNENKRTGGGIGNDIGTLQINDYWQRFLLADENLTPKDLVGLETNIRIAAEIYKKYGWQPWNAAKVLGYVKG